MSHSSNIQLSQELLNFINKCKQDGNARALKCLIKNEQLVLDEYREPKATWHEDFVEFVNKMFEDKQPCFVLMRLDTKTHSDHYDWVFISWSPDNSQVRQKMLYASTKAILKLHFKSNSLVGDYFATTHDELNSVLSHAKGKKLSDAELSLLTIQEQDLLAVKREETIASCAQKSSMSLPGVEFPITDDAIDAIFSLKEGLLGYVQLSIDISKEMIQLEFVEETGRFNISTLESKVPEKSARYHIFIYPHTHNNVFKKSVIFVYSVPSTACSVKERMLYSSCKGPLLNAIQDKTKKIGLEVDNKLEIDDPKDLKEETLINYLYPKEVINAMKFAKPSGPAGKRGARRLIKTNETP